MAEKTKRPVNGRANKNAHNSLANRLSTHFLVNALNSVIALCRRNPEAAAELAGEISVYLQRSLETGDFLIPLDKELEHVLAYINIQKARFPHKLRVVLDIDGGISSLIPAFTLQPLVDNAVKHGILKRKTGGTVSLSVKKLPGSVRITVGDDGPGMSGEQLGLLFKGSSKDRSLYRVNQALKTAGLGGLQIRPADNGGTAAMIEIPA